MLSLDPSMLSKSACMLHGFLCYSTCGCVCHNHYPSLKQQGLSSLREACMPRDDSHAQRSQVPMQSERQMGCR